MPIYPTQDAFNRGEISPKLRGRVSIDLYRRGAQKVSNFVPMAQGGVRKRYGTQYVSSAMLDTGKVRLVGFSPSLDDSYCLEFSDTRIRVYDSDGQRVQIDGGATFIDHPFTDVGAIKFAQSNDVIYIAGGGAHHTFTRYGLNDWRLEELEFEDGPFASTNTDKGARITVSNLAANLATLDATGFTFDPSIVGSFIRLDEEEFDDVDGWSSTNDYAVGDLLRSSGGVYETTVAGKGGGTAEAIIPTHQSGTYSQGPGLASFKFLHSGTSVLKVESYVTSTKIIGNFVSTRPYEDNIEPHAIRSLRTTGTTFWALSEMREGFQPSAVCFFQQRLCYAVGQKVFMSRSGNFKSFRAGTNDDDAISVEIVSTQFNNIQSLFELNGSLMAVGDGGIIRITGGSNGLVTPGNVVQQTVKRQRMSTIQPIETDDSAFVIAKPEVTVFEMAFSNEAGSYLSPSSTIASDHIIANALGVVDATAVKSASQSIYFALKNGTVGHLIFDKYQDVIGWSRMSFSGNVIAVASTPGELSDDVWFVIERQGQRTIERIQFHREYGAYDTDDIAQGFGQTVPATFRDSNPCYVDSAVLYTGSGELTHLNGLTVQWSNGTRSGSATVAGGDITLPVGITEAWVGLSITAKLETLRIDIGRRGDGGDAGRKQRVSQVHVDFLASAGAKVEHANGVDYFGYTTTPDFEAGLDLKTGISETVISNSWSDNGQFEIISDVPLPCVIRSITPITD